MTNITKPLYLGLDLSTQQLKAILINDDLEVQHEIAVHFDRDLGETYGVTNGAVQGPDEGEVTSPVAMWVEAIDLLMQRLKHAGVDLGSISAISGDGQQHGSVYWSKEAENLLNELDSSKSVLEQLFPAAFTFQKSPIWQDSSTTKQCRELEAAVGGAQALADLSGSKAYERFTGNQIARLRQKNPELYGATARISLVSSFIPSVFLGTIAPIEISDASGMNLMDVLTCKWDEKLLDICGGSTLREKLGPEPVAGGLALGKVHSYWVTKWGFNPECIVAPFTGDNPASVIAVSAPGDALLSLGTSTTFLLSVPPATKPPKRFTNSHLLTHPTDPPRAFIAMLCYKNGALAREQVRDKYAQADWDRFNEHVNSTPAGNNGYLGFYFPLPEIIPPNVLGNFFYSTDLAGRELDVIPTNAHPRAILESQLLSIKSRLAKMLPPNSPPLQRLVVTGGSSTNQTIRQVAADIFGMKVFVSTTKESAATGGALLAKWARWKLSNQGSFEDMTGGQMPGMTCVAEPRPDTVKVYNQLLEAYDACEQQVIQKGRGSAE
ncbi:hypothetical protein AGABI1DRAFT_118780 [Agaricus bisporus var. burnettii JB137-S8]|uniref:Xylulose kinase n=1 Tax=Agaricus bisporus var. burnettii (strain JB137-S8 / ATCC MYA-4627 / FGSC 10392) TaxID=597362 RepID=K5XEA9_AGABU|nr:uncharacterized protein AGABI1DRAFT_118780 [Agaricus bisporus var. burnettii JB137-S8]EKM81688.1 hypothetical protein AGABI1DRAFT_118780 [Agaricus bisporus var. burnettii JB137-S8]